MRCGIFVGGRSRRMEGFPKALLRTADDETLLARTVRVVREAGLEPVLVGGDVGSTDVPVVADARPSSGPLGGIVALIADRSAIVVACDMPGLNAADLRRLATIPSEAAVVAPRRDDRWEPLFARYDARAHAVAARRLGEGQLALQGFIDEVGGEVFAIERAALEDVDTVDEAARAGLRITRVEDGMRVEATDALAVEEPLEIRLAYGGTEKTLSITMRTPGDDVALALGFLVSEGIVRSRDDVDEAKSCGPTGNVVRVSLKTTPSDLARLERHFYTTSSCGVCGKTSLEAVRSAPHTPIARGPFVASAIVHALPATLRSAQRAFATTGGLHASGIFDASGRLIVAREDVGRHNALDKAIGERLLAGALPLPDHVLLVSGRASFELVQKAVMAGIPILAAVGAPSSLAVELAREESMTLLGFVRDERFNIYAGAERIGA